MSTTITVSRKTRDRLMRLKLDEGAQSLDEVVDKLLALEWELRFREASTKVRRRMDELDLTPEDLHGDELLE